MANQNDRPFLATQEQLERLAELGVEVSGPISPVRADQLLFRAIMEAQEARPTSPEPGGQGPRHAPPG